MRRFLLAALASAAATATLLAGPGAGRADAERVTAAKSFSLQSLTTEATVATDGAMTVEETIVYVFDGGPFEYGIRSFLAEDRGRITAFSVTDTAGAPLPVIAPRDSVSGEWEWRLAGPTGSVSDVTATYHIEYVVPRAVVLGTDVGELYWQFLGKDHPGIGRVDVVVRVPGRFAVADDSTAPDDATVLRAWGHGPRNGTVAVTPDRVTLAVTGVPASTFVEARIAVPATAFSGDATSGARLPRILDEEGTFIDRTLAEDRGRGVDRGKDTEGLGNLMAPGAGVLGLAGLAAIWARFGREPKPDPMIGEYWREPLDDPPAVVLANLGKGTVKLGPAIGATLIDLAQRGYFTITEERHERFGPDETIHRLHWKGKPTADLAPFERDLVEHVFLGRPEVTTNDITAWAKANQSAARTFAKGFQTKVKDVYAARGYKAEGRGRAYATLAAVAGGIALAGIVSSVLGGRLAVLAYVAAVAVFVAGAWLITNRTQRGADEAAKAESLKRFLKDFSNLEEAPAGHLILWERFLVYAVTLGVAKDLLQGLQTRLPSVANDPNYGVWYVGTGGHFDGIDRFPSTFGTAAATAFAPPSKSGGGGGFSGGGGGGGGGGGFGAR